MLLHLERYWGFVALKRRSWILSESERSDRVRAMAESISAMLEFADQQEDFVLAAKLADVHAEFSERYILADD